MADVFIGVSRGNIDTVKLSFSPLPDLRDFFLGLRVLLIEFLLAHLQGAGSKLYGFYNLGSNRQDLAHLHLQGDGAPVFCKQAFQLGFESAKPALLPKIPVIRLFGFERLFRGYAQHFDGP